MVEYERIGSFDTFIPKEFEINNVVNPYLEYEGRPVILGNSADLISKGELKLVDGGAVIVTVEGEEITITRKKQRDLVEQGFDGLSGNLATGSILENALNMEIAAYEEALSSHDGLLRYGDVVYYPQTEVLVWFPPRSIRLAAQMSRNETLLQDPGMRISYLEQRKIFGDKVVGVIGASVGSAAAHRLRDTLFPAWVKIADRDVFDEAVRNRRRFDLFGYGNNKAEVTATEIHVADPFLPISVYNYGIDVENVGDFIEGNQEIGEPRLDILVDAIDDIEMKLIVAMRAREARVDLWRVSDIGTARQVEFLPYSQYGNFPLSVSCGDGKLEASLQKAKKEPNRDNFFEYAFNLVGPYWKLVPEFREFIMGNVKSPFGTSIPQLAIASEAAASDLATGVASNMLGYDWPHRYFFEPRRGIIIREWFNVENGTILRKAFNASKGIGFEATIEVETDKVLDKKEIGFMLDR